MSAGYGYGYYGATPSAQTSSTASHPSASTVGAVAPIAQTSASGFFGEQRPTFSDDGNGVPYNSSLIINPPSSLNQNVSFDTSSKDPHMIRSRVFIGNMTRALITRDDIIDLFRPFGNVIAVNYFAQQGFAFVQFAEASHADQSCIKLNGTHWKECVLDVHLAMLGALKKPISALPVVAPAIAALPAQPVERVSNKRVIEDEEYEIFKQNKKNKMFSNSDKTINEELTPNEMCDTLVCGNCRFVTSDFEEFKEHRIAGCDKYKDNEEPKHRLKCATCSQRFLGAWGLLEHLTDFHRMLLYNEEPLDPSDIEQWRRSNMEKERASSEKP